MPRQQRGTCHKTAKNNGSARHAKAACGKGTAAKERQCGVCRRRAAQCGDRRTGRSESKRLRGAVCAESRQRAASRSGDRSARDRSRKVCHCPQLNELMLIYVEPVQFVKPLRLLEIYVFDLREHVQKVGDGSVQHGHLLRAQVCQRVSAGKALGVQIFRCLLNKLVGALVDLLCVFGINTGFYRAADPKHSAGGGNADKQYWQRHSATPPISI